MLSPGSATALVNDALEWIQPRVVQMLPRGDTVEGISRGAVGKAPEMLCSALAAVLSFLEAHVTARQAPGDISSITKALLDSVILPRDAASPHLLSVLAQCSAPQPSEAQHSATSDSGPQKQTQHSAPQGSAAQALPVSQSSAGACELLLAVACLGQTLAQHKVLIAQILDSLNAGIINVLADQVSRLLCTAAIISTGLQFSAFVLVRSSIWYAAESTLNCTYTVYGLLQRKCVLPLACHLNSFFELLIASLTTPTPLACQSRIADTARCLQVLTSHTAQAGLVEIQPCTATWFQQQMPQSKLLLHALEHIDGESMLLFHWLQAC